MACSGSPSAWAVLAATPRRGTWRNRYPRPGKRRLGAEHVNTLTACAELAFWTGCAGDPASARDQYAALLPVRERVLGAELPSTLTTRADLADWTGAAGDPASARDQYAELLPVTERVMGAEHADTIGVRARLAHWTKQAKK